MASCLQLTTAAAAAAVLLEDFEDSQAAGKLAESANGSTHGASSLGKLNLLTLPSKQSSCYCRSWRHAYLWMLMC
jgi:hypothetical protein